MQKDSLEIALIKYNKKTWCKSALLGFFIGLAVIVPGISGSTVAIIFKLYDQFLYAVGNFFKKFKICFLFLLPIGLGAVLGFGLGFLAVKKLLELLPFAVICLFAGLMIGAFPAVKDELQGVEMTGKRVALFLLGVLIPLAVGVYSAVSAFTGAESGSGVLNAPLPLVFCLALVVGYVMAITQVVPGLSASAILMAIGWYAAIMGGINETLFSNTSLLVLLGGLVVGFVIGFFSFSKLLTIVFQKARAGAYSMIVGLSLGSVITMFFNGDVAAVYLTWAKTGISGLDLGLGIFLLIVGIAAAYMLVRVQRKADGEKKD
ncbi:MAG: DUF368 domain-containing protein [Clostridia bacterium]|nr:DUF368 domain-containing protein [Clostridia bacterium]